MKTKTIIPILLLILSSSCSLKSNQEKENLRLRDSILSSIPSYRPSPILPIVYSKVEYVWRKNLKQWNTAPNNWTTFEPIHIDNKPTGIIKVTTYSHQRLQPLQTPIVNFK